MKISRYGFVTLMIFNMHIIRCFIFEDLRIEITNAIIRQRTSYTFTFNRDSLAGGAPSPWDTQIVPLTANVTIVFPVQYSQITSAVCDQLFINNVKVSLILQCVKVGNSITLRNFLTQATYIKVLTLKISNIRNPTPSGSTGTFTGHLGNDQADPSGVATLLPGALTTCQATFNGVTANTVGPLTFFVVMQEAIPVSSSIRILFPFSWTTDMADTAIVFADTEYCVSTDTPNLNCYGSRTIQGPLITVQRGVQASSLVLSFTISNILAPTTNQRNIADILTISTTSPQGQIYDTCTTYASGVTQMTISSLVVTPTSTIYTNSHTSLIFTIKFPSILSNTTDQILIDLSSTYSPTLHYTSISGNVNTIQASTSSITLKTNSVLPTNTQLSFSISSYLTPPSVYVLPPYRVQVYRNGYIMMIGQFGLQAQSGLLADVDLLVSDRVIMEASQYVLVFRYDPGLTTFGAIRVYFPQEYFVLGAGLQAWIGTTRLTTNIISNNHGVQLTGLTPTHGTISITFRNITNPIRTSPLQILINIQVFYNSSRMDQVASTPTSYTPIQLTYTPKSGLSSTVSSSSSETSLPLVSLTFSITTNVPLLVGDKILITYDGISLINDDSALLQGKCQIRPNMLQGCYFGGVRQLVVEITISVGVGSTFQLVINDIFVNPPITVAVLATFRLTTTTNDDYTLQTSFTSISLPSMSEPCPFTTFHLSSRTNLTNSGLSDYTFTISQKSPLLPGSNTLTLTFPEQLDISLAQCPTCTKNIAQRRITYSLATSTTIQNQINITILNIRNAVSTQSVQQISCKSTVNFTYVYSYSESLEAGFHNVYPAYLSVIGNYVGRQYGEPTVLQLQIGDIQVQVVEVVIDLQPYIGLLAVQCGIIDPLLCTMQGKDLHVDLSGHTGSITFSINNLLAPTLPTTLTTQILTYSPTAYLISHTSIPPWSPQCPLPCKSCQIPSPNNCLSCYSNPQISPQSIYNPFTNKCIDQCLGNTIQINQQCQQCVINCERCSITVDNCTRCVTGYYLLGADCLAECLEGYYEGEGVCEQCQYPCGVCAGVGVCLGCDVGYYLYEGRCLGSCPVDVTVPNTDQPLNWICVPCSTNCAACTTLPTTCTRCPQNQALQSNTCTTSCSNSYYIHQGLCIPTCIPPCTTCLTLASHCLSCQSPLIFHNNACLSQCPQKHYQSSGFCAKCSDVIDLHCQYCQDQVTCLSCDTGYIFFGNNHSCLLEVPSGYVGVNGVAVQCQGDCLTCDRIVSNCTSCRLGYFHNGFCLLQCPDSHYQVGNVCERCLEPCDNCQDATTCLTCLAGKYLQPDTPSCLPTCPQTYYPLQSSWSCTRCKPQCLTCTSYQQCLSCQPSHFLHLEQCLPSCPHPYYLQSTSSTCQPCNEPCQKCQTTLDTCLTCISGYYYFNEDNTCLGVCPPGYITNYLAQVCTNCTAPCLVCNQTACLRCQAPYSLYVHDCYTDCPADHYSMQMPLLVGYYQCQKCPIQCLSCLSHAFCLMCNVGYLWLQLPTDGICVNQCPEDRPIIENNACNSCSDPQCQQCFPNNQCYNCSNTTILWLGQCLNQCPNNYSYSQQNQTCQLTPAQPFNQTQNSTTQQQQQQSQYGPIISTPVPIFFTIAASSLTILSLPLLFCCSCCGRQIFKIGIICIIWGLVQSVSLSFVYYAFYQYYRVLGLFYTPFGYLLTVILAALFLINSGAVVINYCYVMATDKKYYRWKNKATCKAVAIVYIGQLLAFLNFKAVHLIWSNFSHGPKLETVARLRFLAIVSALGLTVCLAYTIVAVFMIIQIPDLLYIWVDAMVVSIIAAILSGFALRRPQKFFQQSIDGVRLHKRHISADYFETPILKGDQLTESFRRKSQKKQNENQSSQYLSMQTSSRLSVSSLQSFLSPHQSARSNASLLHKSYKSAAQSNKNKQISLQCSILPEDKQSGEDWPSQKSSSFLQCLYEDSGQGNMGSLQQSRDWNGVPMQPVLYRQQYDLNQAIILDADGKLLDLSDYSSNAAAIEQSLPDQSYYLNFLRPQRKQQNNKSEHQQQKSSSLNSQQDPKIHNQHDMQSNKALTYRLDSKNNKSLQSQKISLKNKSNISHINKYQNFSKLSKLSKYQKLSKLSQQHNLSKFSSKSHKINKSQLNLIHSSFSNPYKNQQQYMIEQSSNDAQSQQIDYPYTQQLMQRLAKKQENNYIGNSQIQSIQFTHNKNINQNREEIVQQQSNSIQDNVSGYYANDSLGNQNNFSYLSNKSSNRLEQVIIHNRSKLSMRKNQNPQFSSDNINQNHSYQPKISDKNLSIHHQPNIQQNQNQSETNKDRFDNSIISNHQGSLSSHSNNQEQQIKSFNTNNDGSLLDAKQAQLRKKQEQEKSVDQSDAIQQDTLLNQKNINDAEEKQRWQQLLKEQNQNLSSIEKQQNQENGSMKSLYKQLSSEVIKEIQEGEDQDKLRQQLQKQMQSGLLTQEQVQNILEESRSRSLKRAISRMNKIQQIEEQEQYLSSLKIAKQSNQFQIKTKKKKNINEPRHKVVIVQSKKFSTLKRKASELNKQIKKGQKMKQKIQQNPQHESRQHPRLSRMQSDPNLAQLRSKSKEDKLKSIYLRNRYSPDKKL